MGLYGVSPPAEPDMAPAASPSVLSASASAASVSAGPLPPRSSPSGASAASGRRRAGRVAAVLSSQTMPVYFVYDLAAAKGCGTRIYLTPLGHFVRNESTLAQVTPRAPPPVPRAGVAAATDWAYVEYAVRAGLRESPLGACAAPDGADEPSRAGPAADPRSRASVARMAAAAAAAASSSSSLLPAGPGPAVFLGMVQRFAVVMSTIMLIRKAVDVVGLESVAA